MKYTINRKDILKNLSFSFFLISAFFVTRAYFDYTGEYMPDNILAWSFLSILIPVALIFIEYYLFSYKYKIEVAEDRMKVKTSVNEITFDASQIKSVKVYAMSSLHRNTSFRLLPFEAFHFARIKLEGHNDIYITSLSDYDLFNNIKKEKLFSNKISFHRAFFSSIILW